MRPTSVPVLQRAPGEGVPTGSAPLDGRWKQIARRLDQGSDPAAGEPIVIGDVKDTEVRPLDLASMLLLEAHVDAKISALTPRVPESRQYEEWIRHARNFRANILEEEIKDRRAGVVASGLFWQVTDAAIAELNSKHAAMLARVAPIIWKLVDSGWSVDLDPKEKVRGGYLTEDQIVRIVGAGKKYFGAENLAPHMNDGATQLSQKYKLRSASDRPSDAVSRLVALVKEIEQHFEAALTQIFLETEEVVYGPAKALRASLKQQAGLQPRSILSLMGIENRTEALDSDAEISAAIREIGIASGISGGSSRMVEVEWKGSWYAAKVLTTRADGHRYVNFIGYSEHHDGWYPPSSLRTRTKLAAGDQAWVTWEGGSYPVKILEVGSDEHAGSIRVHWQGYSRDNDARWIAASLVTGFGP